MKIYESRERYRVHTGIDNSIRTFETEVEAIDFMKEFESSNNGKQAELIIEIYKRIRLS